MFCLSMVGRILLLTGMDNQCHNFTLVSLTRAPEQAPLKSKMIYASSKDAIKKKFQGM